MSTDRIGAVFGKIIAVFLALIVSMILLGLSVGVAYLMIKFVEWCAA